MEPCHKREVHTATELRVLFYDNVILWVEANSLERLTAKKCNTVHGITRSSKNNVLSTSPESGAIISIIAWRGVMAC